MSKVVYAQDFGTSDVAASSNTRVFANSVDCKGGDPTSSGITTATASGQ